MIRLLVCICAVTLCGATGCGREGVADEPQTWEVDGSLAVCRGEGAWLCQRYRGIDGGPFSALPCPIAGFDFVWGERAEVVVEEVGFHDPDVDGCGTEYALVEELERSPVEGDASFTLRLVLPRDATERYFVPAEPGRATFMGLEMVCTTASVCEALQGVIDDNAGVVNLSLRYPEASGEPFRLYEIIDPESEAG